MRRRMMQQRPEKSPKNESDSTFAHVDTISYFSQTLSTTRLRDFLGQWCLAKIVLGLGIEWGFHLRGIGKRERFGCGRERKRDCCW